MPNLATIQSGGTVAITLEADPSQANKDFQYTITGIGSSVVKGGVLSGTVKLGNDSTAVINVGTVVTAAQLNTPNETIKVTVGPISASVGLTGSITTNNGALGIGDVDRVNGVINEKISTGTGQAVIIGGSGNVTLDFSGAGTSGLHGDLLGPNTRDFFTGGTAVNTLIIDPMITNVNGVPSTFGTGMASGVQNITLQSTSVAGWFGTEGGTRGVLPINTVDLGLLNQDATFTGIATEFTQTIKINLPLFGQFGLAGQTFKDAVSNDTFVLDNSKWPFPGGSMQGQVIAFDFALPTAINVLNFTANNVNGQGGFPSLVLRDFEINSVAANQQNPVTALNLQMNRNASLSQNSSNVVGGGAGDAVEFSGNSDVSGVNGGGILGPKAARFNPLTGVTMTVVQHNDFDRPFKNVVDVQAITFTTDGTVTRLPTNNS